MSVSIDTVTIGVEDRRLCLSNATAARKLSVGSSWNRIRLGVHYAMDDTGANITGTPRLWIGLLNNPSASAANGPFGTTSHFLGIRSRAATWTRAAGPPVSYAALSCWESVKRVGTTNTTTAIAGTCQFVAAPSTNRWNVFVEIVKGSPNFTVQAGFWNQSVTNVDFTKEQFERCLEAQTFTGCIARANQAAGATKYLGATANAMAVDEGTDGVLNSICVAWDQSGSVFRISDVQFYIIEAA
jgi:hypothetical protein